VLTLPRPALAVVAVATAVRLFIAFHVPLTEDESYYWTWSRHLAYGYVDHPPMVAWLIALTAPFGRSPGFVRLPFVLCEAGTALALARTALLLGGDARAATAAAIAFTAIPQPRLAIGEALPDGPYLLCWALALMLSAELVRTEGWAARRTAVLLGLALGGALLSRFFGWALLLGIAAFALAPARRSLLRRGLAAAFVIALALYAPFLIWNATHHWVNFAFTFHGRQALGAFSVSHASALSSARFLVYAALLWLAAFWLALRPRQALIAWTALPFPTALALLSFFETVESYWLLGPVTSLCVGIGLLYARTTPRVRLVLTGLTLPALYTTASVLFLTLPQDAALASMRATHGALRGLSSGVFAYEPFAHDVRALTHQGHDLVLTDEFEVASELEYYGLSPLLIGRSAHADQSRAWHGPITIASDTLVISLHPLAQDTELAQRLARAYRSVQPGPLLRYTFAGGQAMAFSTTWCRQPRGGALATLFAPAQNIPAAR
jgi:4-amino-4-deoxy-L-arabinose transferase-like glycosyltransferase